MTDIYSLVDLIRIKVPDRGFEPRFTASEAGVLPLDESGL